MLKKKILAILMSICMVFGVGAFGACNEVTETLDMAIELEELNSENNFLKENLENLTSENNSLKETTEGLLSENDQLNSENNSLKEENNSLNSENNSLKEENNSLNSENNSLKEELAALKFQIAFPNGIINKDAILNSINRLVPDGEEGDAIQVTGNSTVTINGGKFNGGQTPLGGAGNTAIWVNSADAKVLINDGEFTIGGLAEGDTGHIDLIYVSQGTVEITGGYFYGADDTVWLLNCKDTFYKDGTASIVVKGGTFVNFDPSNCVSEGENTNFVAEGYVVVMEEIEGTRYYTVVEAPAIEEPEIESPENF